MDKVLLVIPAYNEEKNIERVVDQLTESFPELDYIVVNDDIDTCVEDLHSLIEKKAEANPDNPVFRDLAMLLYDAAKGSDSFLWNYST